MQSEVTTKMGFLAFPFTMTSDILNAIKTNSGWCTTTNCTKDFGLFMGNNFTINFAQMNTTFPTIFNLVLNLVRGLTVIILIVMLRAKYQRLVEK